jgi:hypothetical protein
MHDVFMQSEAEAHEAPEVTAEETPQVEEPMLPTEEVSAESVETIEEIVSSEPVAVEEELTPIQQYERDKETFFNAPEEPAGEIAAEVEGESNKEVLEIEADQSEEEYIQAAMPEESEVEAEVSESKSNRPPQYRHRPRTEIGERYHQLLKENPDMTEPEAMAKAQAEINPEPASEVTQPEASTEPSPETPTVELPEEILRMSPSEISSKLMEMRTESAKQLQEDYDVEAYGKRQLEIVEMEQAQMQMAIAQNNFERQEQESLDRVVSKYPTLKDPDSDFTKRVSNMADLMISNNHPMSSDPNFAELVADHVKQEMDILGVSVNTESFAPAQANNAPVQKPVPHSKVPARKVQAAPQVAPVSGANRTHSPQSQVAAALDKVMTPDDFEDAKLAFLARKGS